MKYNKPKVILALDVATTTGWSVMIDGEIEAHGHFKIDSLGKLKQEITGLIILWKPTHVIAASPTRFFNTIFLHGKFFGVIEYTLEKFGLSFWMDKTAKGKATLPIDSKMKKAIFGKGVVSKQEIMDWAGVQQEDQADAVMMATYLNKQLT